MWVKGRKYIDTRIQQDKRRDFSGNRLHLINSSAEQSSNNANYDM